MGRRDQDIERHIVDLRRYACALLGSAADAEDLVQETLLRALARHHVWTSIRDMRAYLFTILHNAHLDRLTTGRGASADVDNGEARLAQPPGQLLSRELRDIVRAVAALPLEQREVVLLIGLEGMTYRQASDILDVPVGTVMSRLSRGRAALHQMVDKGLPASHAGFPGPSLKMGLGRRA